MADTSHQETSSKGTGIDMKAHAGGYNLFVGMFKWGTIATAIIAAVVVYLIAN